MGISVRVPDSCNLREKVVYSFLALNFKDLEQQIDSNDLLLTARWLTISMLFLCPN